MSVEEDRAEIEDRGAETADALRLIAIVLVVAFSVALLYLGRDVLVPLALAVLLSFLLAPLVRFMRRLGLGHALPVILAMLLSFALLLALTGIVALQLSELADSLPRYQATIVEKIRAARAQFAGGASIERLLALVNRLASELGSAAPAAAEQSVPVVVREEGSAWRVAGQVLGPLLKPLVTIGLVFLFGLFILFQREDLRNRFIRLAGSHDLQRTTSAIDDAAQRLSRLFLMQFALNATYGLIVAGGLTLIGVPSAVLFGILAGILRFVPYIGAVLGALLPIALAFAVEPGWQMAVQTAVFFLIVEPIVGHVAEPMLYGRSTGMTPVAVVISVAFWTTLWGPIGLVLATPLTVCLVVIGRHVERLEFLEVALGDRPPLTPEQIFYQRMLAGDPEEAAAQAEAMLQKESLIFYLDQVVLPALAIAQADLERGALDEPRAHRLLRSIRTFAASLIEPGTASAQRARVKIVGGRSIIDEAAALLIAQALGEAGYDAGRISLRSRGPSATEAAPGQEPEAAVLVFVGAAPELRVRYRLRRIRTAWPETRVLMLASGGAPASADGPPAGIEAVVPTLAALVSGLDRPAAPPNSPERTASLPAAAVG